MDLSTGSIGWHRTRQWLDSELERLGNDPGVSTGLTPEQAEYRDGYLFGQYAAYARVRARFYTDEESAAAEETRREMFG